jgi:predicted nicotinamide N-methyase
VNARDQHVRRVHGLKILLSHHPRIRRLKRIYQPEFHGNKVWTSGLTLIDFINKSGMARNASVLDIGCGWGLAGVFCAKKFGARVTGMDTDPNIFPYLELHAEINKVGITPLVKGYDRLTPKEIKGYDILIGSDICFWDSMVKPFKRLISLAIRNGSRRIIFADPGRESFLDSANSFVEKGKGELLWWESKGSKRIASHIYHYTADETAG